MKGWKLPQQSRVSRAADLYDEGEDAQLKSSEIKKLLKGVDLSTKEFVNCTSLEYVIEDYFGLKAVAEGAPVDQAWGSMWFNTTVETIGNKYDYQRYRQILELNNPREEWVSCSIWEWCNHTWFL